MRQSKETLRTEIESLRHRQRSSDQVFAALVRPNIWEEVLARLRNGHSVETISEWLGANLSSSQGTRASSSATVATAAATPGPSSGFPSNDANLGPGHGLGPPPVFGGVGQTPLPSINLPVNTLSPIQLPGLRNDISHGSHGSPWHFSSQSQTGSVASSSHPDAMNWTADMSGPPQTRVGSWAEGMHSDHMSDDIPRFRGLEQVLSPLNEPEMKSPAGTWTSITSDVNLVQHLLALYFCWEYPTFASLSKEHFLRDFQDGRHRFCSSILVNALLALGCRFSTQPMTRANPNDPYTSGDHFFKESQRLFNQETDHHSLTTIQALGIMSIREASCGRDSESWYYAGQSIRLAIEMGLHRIHDEGDEDELAVQSATFWGAFALDQ